MLFTKFRPPKIFVNNLSKLGTPSHLKTPETTNIQENIPKRRYIKLLFFNSITSSFFKM